MQKIFKVRKRYKNDRLQFDCYNGIFNSLTCLIVTLLSLHNRMSEQKWKIIYIITMLHIFVFFILSPFDNLIIRKLLVINASIPLLVSLILTFTKKEGKKCIGSRS